MAKQCPDCGEHRWAAAGYCLSVECAGNFRDPDYPKSAPEELKWNRDPLPKSPTKPRKKAAPKPPKKGRRALELQYEARGEIAPWLEHHKPEGS